VAERTPDLNAGLAVVRRRWYVVAVAGLLGLAAGVLYSALVPAQLTSKAVVLLASNDSSGGDSGDSGILTQVQIVLSTPVLAKAGTAVTPRLSAAQVRERVTVEGATSQLVAIFAVSSRAHEAEALAQAVAESYVATLVDNARSVTGEIVGDLRTRAADLTQQIKNLQVQLVAANGRMSREPPRSPARIRDGQLTTQLTAEQADVATQLERVRSQLAASGAFTGGSTLASILSSAEPATGTGPVTGAVTWGGLGALLGAVVGAGAVVLRARRDPRLRARDDVADAVGSTVIADVRSRPQRSVAEWSALLEAYEASPVDAWAFRQLLRALAFADSTRVGRVSGRVEHPRSVTVVTLAGDRRGLAIAPQLAAFAASLGLSTRFVLATGHDAAASLWAACSMERGSQPRPNLTLEARAEGPGNAAWVAGNSELDPFDRLLKGSPPAGPDGEDGAPAQAPPSIDDSPEVVLDPQTPPRHPAPDLTIVLAVLDGKEPRLGDTHLTAATILAIAPGVGTREELAQLAVAVDDAGRRIDGVVVADPDPDDRTTGRRTLDERARQAPLPLRITGVGQTALPIERRGG
jgi:capsular polysaccharide biosynthesis protein